MSRADLGATAFGALFVVAGSLHFVLPGQYRAIVPAYLPAPELLVALSGVAELAGGAGVMIRRWRRPAATGLAVLLVAVFPANIEMLRQAHARDAGPGWEAALWLRLPLQLLLIGWALRLCRSGEPPPATGVSRPAPPRVR